MAYIVTVDIVNIEVTLAISIETTIVIVIIITNIIERMKHLMVVLFVMVTAISSIVEEADINHRGVEQSVVVRSHGRQRIIVNSLYRI